MKEVVYEDKPCECAGPGYCERFGIVQTEYAFRVCSEQCTEEFPCSKETSRGYREKWASGKVSVKKDDLRKLVRGNLAEKAAAKQKIETRRNPPRTDCIHLGTATGEIKECASCNRTVRHEVFACDKHEKCLLSRSVDGLKCCRHCEDYQSRFSLPVIEQERKS